MTAFPLRSLGACISDFTAQGDTLLRALLDLGWPAYGKFTRANLYVMLSRVPSAERVRILRLLPFEKYWGLRIDPDLDYELQRLDRASEATLRRQGAL